MNSDGERAEIRTSRHMLQDQGRRTKVPIASSHRPLYRSVGFCFCMWRTRAVGVPFVADQRMRLVESSLQHYTDVRLPLVGGTCNKMTMS
jgi:hypothetical protein